jgi:hypothetical protein
VAVLAVIAVTALLVARCSGSSSPIIIEAGPGILVISSDYGAAGSYSYVPSSGAPVLRDIAAIASDAVAAFAGGRLAIINRFGQDNILYLTRALAPSLQFSVGAGSNPYDIAEIDASRVLVSRWASAALWVVDAATGNRLADIDLSIFADSDLTSEMAYMASAGNPRRILIALQRLTNFAPSEFSSFVVFNPQSLTVEAVREFSLKNPVTRWVSDGTHLYIGLVGVYGVADGGIARVNGVSLSENGILLSETDLNQDIGAFTYAGGRFYLITSDPSCGAPPWTPCTTRFYEYLPPAAPVLLKTAPGFHYSGVALLPGTPYVALADRNPSLAGIWFYDTRARAFTTTTPIPVSNLPPADLLAVY